MALEKGFLPAMEKTTTTSSYRRFFRESLSMATQYFRRSAGKVAR